MKWIIAFWGFLLLAVVAHAAMKVDSASSSTAGSITLGTVAGDVITVNSASTTYKNDTFFTGLGGVNAFAWGLNNTSALSIDTTNKFVGIGSGAIAPDAPLTVGSGVGAAYMNINGQSGNNSILDFGPVASPFADIYTDTSFFYIRSRTNIPIIFGINGNEKARFDLAGNFGIQNTTPLKALDVTGGAAVSSSMTVTGITYAVGGYVVGFATDTLVARMAFGSAAFKWGATAAGACDVATMTVSGCVDGDILEMGIPIAISTASVYQVFKAVVSLPNVVSVSRCNLTNAVTALTPTSSGTFKIRVVQ